MKTTLSIESWYKKFSSLVNKVHPTFEQLFICSQTKHSTIKKLYLEIKGGNQTIYKNKTSLSKLSEIKKQALKPYTLKTSLEHLENIANTINKS